MKIDSKYLIAVAILACCWGCGENNKKVYDASAIQELDKLTETIGNLTSCSFTLNSQLVSSDGTSDRQSDVYFGGENKMYIFSDRNDIRRGFWYDGSKLSVFDFDNKGYDEVNAPRTIMETIDSVHNRYGIDFPAADFFYPTFTDDLMAQFDAIVLNGSKAIDGADCHEIFASNKNLEVFIYIDKSTKLPKQFEIYHLDEKKGNSFVATFSNWKENPNLSANMFKFSPPSNATKSSIFK